MSILSIGKRIRARREERAQEQAYFRPYVMRRYTDAGGILHIEVAACHSSHVTTLLHGQTLEGNASWHVRRIGNQLYEITAEPWNTNTDPSRMNAKDRKAYYDELQKRGRRG